MVRVKENMGKEKVLYCHNGNMLCIILASDEVSSPKTNFTERAECGNEYSMRYGERELWYDEEVKIRVVVNGRVLNLKDQITVKPISWRYSNVWS